MVMVSLLAAPQIIFEIIYETLNIENENENENESLLIPVVQHDIYHRIKIRSILD